MATTTPKFSPIVSIVGFHHARGPEVEHWVGVEDENALSEWPLLPFMALSDGAHSSSEDFSYFTLKHVVKNHDGTDNRPISLFGISCTRQLDSSTLIDRPPEVTRSTVQKAVVVIADSPVYFGGLKEKLGMVTRAWFAQRNFDDLDIIRKFQESLKQSLSGNEQYLGLSLRELVFEFRQQTLVLFKCCLLQPKMLFFGSRCERLCITQFSLLSLIPGLLNALEDCADPELNYYEGKLFKPTSVKTSDRKSLLTFMGMPLQIFGKGSLFGPYTPLQQLDILADVGTKSYVVGSTNSLLLQQRDRYSDILINLDELSVNITSSSLRTALYLTAADRRWIDSIVQAVAESWDENDPSRPNTMGFVGSEDYIRLQFEEYALSMVSSVKCHDFLQKHAGSASRILPDVDGDPAIDFGMDFIDMWKKTENYRIFQKFTDSELFDLVTPKHVMAGGLTMDDVSRRISQQLNDLKLDEKMVNGREAVAKTLVAGRGKLGAALSTLTSNVVSLREAQAKKLNNPEPNSPAPSITPSVDSSEAPPQLEKPADQFQPAKTGYFASWASWAGEKKRKAFGGTPAQTPSSSPPMKATPSCESASVTPSIGSPKVPIGMTRRDSYTDIYDPETGIGKGDSGFISPPYRASLDTLSNLKARKTGIMDATLSPEEKSEAQTNKGLFSVFAEQFQMVDVRKSLPPPPLPEKESFPEKIREKHEEDNEFLENLRKSLPPPPSEIDDFPDMIVAPRPPPGPLVAQEEVYSEPLAPSSIPLLREVHQSPKAALVVLPVAKENFGPNITLGLREQKQESPRARVQSDLIPIDDAASCREAVANPPSPPRQSRTARLKARNLLRQYVVQENTSQRHAEVEGASLTERRPDQKLEKGEVPVYPPNEPKAPILKTQIMQQSIIHNLEAQSAVREEDSVLGRSQIMNPEDSSSTAEGTKAVVEERPDHIKDPKLVRSKAKVLTRKYVTPEQQAEPQLTQREKPKMDEETHCTQQTYLPHMTETHPPTAPQSSDWIPESPEPRPAQTQTPESIPAPGSTLPQTLETPLKPLTRTFTVPMNSPVLSPVPEGSPRVFKRKSIPTFSAGLTTEFKSPTRENAEPLKISKRKATLKHGEEISSNPRNLESTNHMKRRPLRSFGGEYASSENALEEKGKEQEKETLPSMVPDCSPPSQPPLIQRKSIPTVFTQAEAILEQKPKTPRAAGVGVLPRTPSPGLSTVSNNSTPTTPFPSERRTSGRSRSGTVAHGPANILMHSKNSVPTLPNIKDFPIRNLRTSSQDSPSTPPMTEMANIAAATIARPRRAPSIDGDSETPPSPGKIAVAESRTGPGRIGGGLKDNPFLKNDLATPGAGAPLRKRVGTLKNNPFIKNDVKSSTSPHVAPGGAR